MSLSGLLNQEVTIKRKTDVLLEKQRIATVLTGFNQPAQPCRLFVDISGASEGSGQVLVTGTVAGLTDSELFQFAQNGFKLGRKDFSAISGITTSGFTDETIIGKIEIRSRQAAGQPVYQEITIYDKLRSRIVSRRGSLEVTIPGEVEREVTKLYCRYDATKPLKPKDLVYTPNKNFVIDFIKEVYDRTTGIHHLECILT